MFGAWDVVLQLVALVLAGCLGLMFLWHRHFVHSTRTSDDSPEAQPLRASQESLEGTGEGQGHRERLMCRFEEFESTSRAALVAGATQEVTETFNKAISFAHAIVEGIAPFQLSSELVAGEEGSITLRLTPPVPLRGEFATRSRIPFGIHIGTQGVVFRLSRGPPATACPYRCTCHLRCFGPLSGDPKLPWAELSIQFASGTQKIYAAACQAVPVELSGVVGARVVYAPKNNIGGLDLKGAAVIFMERDKPDTVSDGALVRAAKAAGACCVIKAANPYDPKVFRLPDPMEIPLINILDKDGRDLIEALASQSVAHIARLDERDQRATLQAERWGEDMVSLYCDGLYLRTLDWDDPLIAQVMGISTTIAEEPLIYEDYFGLFKSDTVRFSPMRSKLRRTIESCSTPLRRVGVGNNPYMMGKVLGVGGQHCQLAVDYVRFMLPQKSKGVTCVMLLSPVDIDGAEQGKFPPTEAVQAQVAHEAAFLELQPSFRRLLAFAAPSLLSFLECTNGEYLGWKADAAKIVKLFSACSGPVGPMPAEEWQRCDPTWRIVDEKNALGMATRTQGRVLWSEERGGGDTAALVAAPAVGNRLASLPLLARVSRRICCSSA